MKKLYYFVAIATFALFSCQQDDDPVNNQKGKSFTFKASIEEGVTRGDINSSNGLNWADGDKIGIYYADWGEKNQSFTLSTGAGTTLGEFTRDQDSYIGTDASAAFYPWTNNHIDGEWAYFTLNNGYDNYTSGKMLTPLVATVSHNGETYNPISFKHAGAAVKLIINNLPAHAHSIGMFVDGQQVYGSYKIKPANAGTDALVLNESSNTSKNEVWLNYTNASESKWTFIFPVPELTKPKLSFKIYDDNDVLVWSANLKAQANDLGRGDILVMGEKDITLYSKFVSTSGWKVHGTLNGTDWNNFDMVTDGSTSIAKGLTFTASGEFKVTDFTNYYPTGGSDSNWKITTAGTYDIIFNNDTKAIHVVSTSDYSYPSLP